MGKTNVINLLFVLTLLSFASALAAEEDVTVQFRMQRLAEIDQYIAFQRRQTEIWYKSLLEEAILRAEARFREFEQDELERLAQQELVRRTYLRDNHFDIPPGSVLSEEQMAAVENRIAQKDKEIAAQLGRSIEELDRRKEYVLGVLLPELEERLLRDAAAPKPVTPPGMVTAIVYSPDRALALVGDAIVAGGEEIEGVEIAAIEPHAVVFKKGEHRWEQGVRQNPAEFWN